MAARRGNPAGGLLSQKKAILTTPDARLHDSVLHPLRQTRAQAREFLKLTHRHHPAGSPLRGNACALSIRTYRPLTRAPSTGPSCVLYVAPRKAYIGQTHFLMHLPSPLEVRICNTYVKPFFEFFMLLFQYPAGKYHLLR